MASEPGAPNSGEQGDISKIGRYEVVVELGRGGMGMVVKARNPDLNKLVAIKVLNSAGLIDGTSIERFKIEAKAGSQFSHPNVVSIFDFGVTVDGSPYMVMEYIAGESLQDKLTAETKVQLDVVLKIFEQVAKGLQSIHKQNIVHRDIKASNIMLQNIEGDLYAKLVDFGIAKVLTDGPLDPQKLTKTGSVFGSPPYMSPEQCQGKVVDARSDIYSLGCVMYECLSGVPPIMGDNALQTIFGHVSIEPQPLEELKSDDKTVVAAAKLIHKCLQKDPALRYQSCAELITEITSIKGQRDAKQYNSQENAAAPAQPSMNRWKTNSAQSTVPPDASDGMKVLNTGQITIGNKVINVVVQAGGAMPASVQNQSQEHSAQIASQAVPPQEAPSQRNISQRAEAKVPASMEKFPSEKLTVSPAEPPVKADDLRNITQSQLSLKQQSASMRGASASEKPRGFPFLLAVPLVATVVLLVLFACNDSVFVEAVKTGLLKNFIPPDDFEKAKKDFALGKAHWDTARQEFLNSLDVASKKNDSLRTGQIRNYLGKISLGSSDGRALINFTAALKELEGSKETNKEEYFNALTGLAEAQMQQSDLQSAAKSLKDAKDQAARLMPSPEVLGDISLIGAKLASRDSKKLHEAANLYDRALQQFEKSTSASADKKTSAWLESAKLYTTLQLKDQANQHAEKAIATASGISDEADRTEMIRHAQDVLAANKTTPNAASAHDSTPGDPAKFTSELGKMTDANYRKVQEVLSAQQGAIAPANITPTDVALSKAQADLTQAQLDNYHRTLKNVQELQQASDERFKQVNQQLQKLNNYSQPAGY